MWEMNMSLDKFIIRSRKAGLYRLRLSRGLFDYCPEFTRILGNEGRYIKLSEGGDGDRLYFLEKMPKKDISPIEAKDEYINLMLRMFDEGFILYDYLPRDFYKKP
jgi:hypothetical protein